MKRRSTAKRGTKQRAKALRRKVAAEVRLPRVSAAAAKSAASDPNARLEQRSRELKAARDQLAAMSDVLRVISSSAGDLKPVFDTILAHAVRICGARFGNLSLVDGDRMRMTAMYNAPRAFEELRKGDPVIPLQHSPLGKLFRTKKTVHIGDLADEKEYADAAIVKAARARAVLCVPMLRQKELVGALVIYRLEPRLFTDRQAELLTSFAAQAVIAIENARLFEAEQQRTRELAESLEQQTATSEVLRVISSSPGDLGPVFASMLENAVRICAANIGIIYRREGDALRLVTTHGLPPVMAEALSARSGRRPRPDSVFGRMMASKSVVHIADPAREKTYVGTAGFAAAREVGIQAFLLVPMLKEDEVVGAFAVARNEARPFTDKQIALIESFAAQAVIAIENARLLSELRESLEQQTASADVLRVISRSQGDLQPVFAAILENATRLCEASFGNLPLYEGDGWFRMAAMHNAPAGFAELRRREPKIRADALARMAASKHWFQIPDITETPAFKEGRDPDAALFVKLTGVRTLMGVPMLKDGELVGGLVVYRTEVRPFSDRQVELLKNFAAQAVIAIENARLLNELRESLAQQTATADVLKVISRSTFDLQMVLNTLTESASRLCAADNGVIMQRDGDVLWTLASYGFSPEAAKYSKEHPLPGNRGSATGRAALEGRAVQIPDVLADPEYRATGHQQSADYRTVVGVPLLREGTTIGVFGLMRKQVNPFTQKQIELATTFADQAVIAIENARLLSELRESLEQQTATADVLRVISSSPGELQPVFDTMLENATRLCQAPFGTMLLRDGAVLRIVARHVPASSSAIFERGSELVIADNPIHPLVRVLETKDAFQVADLHTDPSYTARNPRVVAFVETVGARTGLCVPLMKDDECIGAFVTCRQEVRPFTDKQIDLVKNFAAQAVIAIENARLLRELRQRTDDLTESLEQQTAMSEVLGVISRSAFDLQAVFETVVERSARLSGAAQARANIFRFDGELLRVAATFNVPPNVREWLAQHPIRPGQHSGAARAALERRTIHVADVLADSEYTYGATAVEPYRTILAVPILKADDLLGVLLIYLLEVKPFTAKQIALVETFADQAAIAIENVRLFEAEQQRSRELSESLEQQTATSEVLQVISSSPGDLQPVFAAVLENATRICEANFGVLSLSEGDAFRLVGMHNAPPAYVELRRREPTWRLTGPFGRAAEQAIATKRAVQIADLADRIYQDDATSRDFSGATKARSFIIVPLIKENTGVGLMAVYRQEVRPFSDKHVDLLTSFAAQAVIAIENARLLSELRQRTTDLTESLEQQTATSEVLRVISSSPGELEPVFQTILENATRICGANFGMFGLREGEAFPNAATYNMPEAYMELRRRTPRFKISPKHPLGRLAATKQVVHVADLKAEDGYREGDPSYHAMVDVARARTLLLVPMLKDADLIGAITIFRQEVRPFTEKQIELVKNFAAQAVIAIENARLLSELRARTDELGRSVGELRALGEVSQAVNSTLDLETVLSTIVAKAVQLSNTDAGAIYVFDQMDHEFHLRATYGMDQDLIDALGKQHISLEERNVALVLAQREPVQAPDLREEASNALNAISLRAGFRARLTAPLIRGRDIVGLLVVRRRDPGAFPQNTVDLIKTFAAQSVLAIQNARLFHEIEDKSRELEVAGQHKSQFLANMSHELRTPLNAIIGYSEILQEDVADVGQESLVPDLKKIEGAGRHLLGLINDILDLSKVEAGRMEVFLEDVEIVPVLEEVRALIVPLAEKNANTLEFHMADGLGTIRTDRTKLKQSLLNILSNGSKFTENGRLTLAAERYDGSDGRPMVRFAISDTGIGMTEEQLGQLFQAFSQADASTTKKYGGTGLGLAISRQFCRLLGGDIAVTSRLGEGSTFTVTLPVRTDAPAQISPAEAPRIVADVNGATTVLIVDDDPAARDLLSASLKTAGYRLVHAASGAEALGLARTLRPDAITLDVMMPKPDGWDVLGALKADPELADIPVVMVTMAPDRGIGLSLGAVDVLTKPVDRARLTALINRLVRREGPILVVEDDADTREMMRHTIERMGHAVAETVNGRLALSWLGEHAAPAMILLDLMMPEMDGFEFLDALATRAEWREIPVIVVTAKQLTAAERERLLRQARKVMEKATATRADIAAAISEAVRRRPARVPAGANGNGTGVVS